MVLQIASGMYFRPGVPLHETLHRFTVYSNGLRIDSAPVELPIASLRFSTGMATPLAPVTVEVWDRLEAERPDGEPEFMVATGGEELVADVATVLAFALNTTWSTDRDLVRRLVPNTLPVGPRGGPSSQLRGTFDPQVLLSDDALADAAAFSTRLLALRRPEYEKAIRAIRRVVDRRCSSPTTSASPTPSSSRRWSRLPPARPRPRPPGRGSTAASAPWLTRPWRI